MPSVHGAMFSIYIYVTPPVVIFSAFDKIYLLSTYCGSFQLQQYGVFAADIRSPEENVFNHIVKLRQSQETKNQKR